MYLIININLFIEYIFSEILYFPSLKEEWMDPKLLIL